MKYCQCHRKPPGDPPEAAGAAPLSKPMEVLVPALVQQRMLTTAMQRPGERL